MAYPLHAQVVSERIDVGGTEGLGPVSRLPSETFGEKTMGVDVVGGSTFEALDEVRERNAGRHAKEDVHVIRAAACGEQRTGDVPRFAAEDARECFVERPGEDGLPMAGGPDDMDEEQSG